jgi:D-arabinose 1-dehydrogenase-like Zn-dependent alcohol dehydrogenase
LISSLLDKALDWTVLPGYSRVGYAVRGRLWNDAEPNAAPAGWSVLVTGAGAGIGASACERFARLGATVHMLVRDREKGERARARIAQRTGSDRLQVEICDVSSSPRCASSALASSPSTASCTRSSTTPA